MTVDDELEIPSGGAVFTFGRSRFADDAPSKFWIKNDEIAHIACGDQHTAVLTGNGRVFTIGCNDQGQLGLNSRTPVVKPSCVKALKSQRSVLVACGRAHTIAATETGGVYSWGHNDEGQLGTGDTDDRVAPQLVLSLPAPPVGLAAGSAHSVLLTGGGEVLVWGSGSSGQLGVAVAHFSSPTALKLNCAVRQVACGYYHTLLLTDEGTVLSFGDGGDGQLGRDASHEPGVPHPVPGLSQRPTHVAAGGKHSLLLTETGAVLSCGRGTAGQLGQGPKVEFSENFQPILSPEGESFVAISAGHAHSAACTGSGQVYVWGCGRHDKLGLGDRTGASVALPTLLPRLRHLTAALVACGGCHTMVLGYPPSAITPPHLHKNSAMLPPIRGSSALPPLPPTVAPAPQPAPPQESVPKSTVDSTKVVPDATPLPGAAEPEPQETKPALNIKKETGEKIASVGGEKEAKEKKEENEVEEDDDDEGEVEEGDEEELEDSDPAKQKKGNALVRFLSHWGKRKTSSSPQEDLPETGLLEPQLPQAPASTPVPHQVRPATAGGADGVLDVLEAEERVTSAPSATEVTRASLHLPPDDDKGHGGIVHRLRSLRKVNNITDGHLEEAPVPHPVPGHPGPPEGQTHGSPAHMDAVQSKACVLL